MFSIIGWLITGLIVGLIARALVPGKQSLGIIMTIVLGVVGAMVGGFISSLIWPAWSNDPNISTMWPGWLMSVVGAIVVLAGYLMLTNKRALA